MIEKKSLIKDSKDIAVQALKHFIKNLELNENIFNHIYNIEIKIDQMEEDKVAEYDPITNKIFINDIALEEYKKELEYVKTTENKVKVNLANAITHEMIHANRTIQMNIIEKDENDEIIPTDQIKIDIPSAFYHKNDNRSEEYKQSIIKNQISFEEMITEALALIITINRKKEKLDLEEINEIIQANEENIIIKMGSQILTNIGITYIKWFILSAYDEVYDDKFAKIFEEEYENLLTDVTILDNMQNYNKYKVIYSIEDANKIIEEKTGKKR